MAPDCPTSEALHERVTKSRAAKAELAGEYASNSDPAPPKWGVQTARPCGRILPPQHWGLAVKSFLAGLAVVLALCTSTDAFAQQTTIPSYASARRTFWRDLYPNDGHTYSDIYCGFDFKSRDDVEMQVEHAYPANWMAKHLGCGTRKHCEQTSDTFNHMEADLHNLWPSEASANNLRSNHLYAIIPGEDWAFEDCDLEISGTGANKVVEPREIARGNLARSILYMHAEYDLPVDPAMGALLKQWNTDDPPSADERRRNGVIEGLEGKRNPFIDDPSRANAVTF